MDWHGCRFPVCESLLREHRVDFPELCITPGLRRPQPVEFYDGNFEIKTLLRQRTALGRPAARRVADRVDEDPRELVALELELVALEPPLVSEPKLAHLLQ